MAEYIKGSICSELLPLYHMLFSTVLDSGVLPTSWLIGYIIPLYKHKGDTANPENYRPITILSCLGKVFTAILNERLTSYLKTNTLLNINQAGFRKKHSTSDGMFLLHTLAEMYKRKNMKLFCCFIDFQKAFDSVWRAGLWAKLWNCNVHDK